MIKPRHKERVRFCPRGPLAIEPSAYGLLVDMWDHEREEPKVTGPVAVVDIQGPIVHHDEGWFWGLESYDAIKSKVERALSEPTTKCILLSIDSPGGLVAGCFDTVREIRALAAEYGKPVYSYVNAQAESAAYALACAGERIYIPAAGRVGSIGVLEMLLDATAADEQWGMRFTAVTSGARKADGNPHVPTSEATVAAVQGNIDTLAGLFFELVGERRGLTPEAIRGLEARTVIGQDAVALGLADEVATLDETVAMLTAELTEGPSEGTEPPAPSTATEAQAMGGTEHQAGAVSARADTRAGVEPVGAKAMKLSEAKAGLKALAEDENAPEDDRQMARNALAAMEPEAEPEGQDEQPESEPEEEPEGQDDEEDEPEAEAEAEAPEAPCHQTPKASSRAVDMTLAARVQVLERQAAQRREKGERRTLLAKRPDFAPEVAAFVARLPIAQMREACREPAKANEQHDPTKHGLPRGPGKGGQVSAARAAVRTAPAAMPANERAHGGVSNLSGRGEELDRRMGFSQPDEPVRMEGATQRLGVMTRQQAQAFMASRKGAAE